MDDAAIKVDATYDRLEQWMESNKQIVFGALAVVGLVVAGFLAYKFFIQLPKERTAQEEIFMSEQWFEEDNYQKALDGDDNYMGLEEIVGSYGKTKAGRRASYLAGICHLNLGNFEDAIDYLERFSTKDPYVGSVALGGLGDAHAELGEFEESVNYYKKAADKGGNKITSPMYLIRAGKVYEELEEYENAKKQYTAVIEKYPNSSVKDEAEKHKARVAALLD